ncbi:MAG: ferredoxin oxidoreductase [Desulfobulbaceae bacterium]|nr:MAG: ferredoxin oxidoreductase [Desulfobulbaceae bacterium]
MSLAITKINPAFTDVMPQEYLDLVADGPFGTNKSAKDLGLFKELIEDHPLCAGCNLAMAFRTLISSLPAPEDTVIVGSTGCNSLVFPQLAIHNVHSLFGNQNAVATGLKRGLKLRFPDKNKDVVVMAGDGATADIGFDMTLHSWIRGEKITTVMFDNELYANTGGQESGMTQFGTVRNMAPTGKKFQKIQVTEFAKLAGCVYVAKLSTANTAKIGQCLRNAVLVAREIGPTYIQIYTPCSTNLKIKPADSVALAKKRVKDDYAFEEYMTAEAEQLLVASGAIKPKKQKDQADKA